MTDTAEDPAWPDWLAAIYGPAPKGPRVRAEALRKDAERKAAIDRRLDAMPFRRLEDETKPPPPPHTYTADELRRARIALGIETPDTLAAE